MIESAASFDSVLLTRIGRRLAEIIDPDGVQARDEKPIREKEDDAYRGRDLTLTPAHPVPVGRCGPTRRGRVRHPSRLPDRGHRTPEHPGRRGRGPGGGRGRYPDLRAAPP